MSISSFQQWLFNKNLSKYTFGSSEITSNAPVGFYFNAKSDQEMASFERYLQNHKKRFKNHKTLIYDDSVSKEAVEGRFFKNNISKWTGIPSAESITQFLNTPFSLFYFLIEEELMLKDHFIINKVHAAFKIGLYKEEIEQFFDLMVDIRSHDLAGQLHQIDHTIEQLKLKI